MKYKEILEKYRDELDEKSIKELESKSNFRLALDDLKFEIEYFLDNKIYSVYYNIKNGIKNFWNYKSVIWNDRWYDHSYIIAVIKFKLQQNINQWDKAHYVGSNFTKKRMIVILNRLEEFETNLENIEDMYYNKNITKYEFIELKNKIINDTWFVLGKNIRKFWD